MHSCNFSKRTAAMAASRLPLSGAFLAALCAAFFPASGLETVTGRMDLQEVVSTALECNLSVREAEIDREGARGAMLRARSEALPHISLGADAAANEDDGQYSASVSLAQALYRSGAVSSAIRYSGLYAKWVENSILETKSRIAAEAAKAYLDVLLAVKMAGVYDEALKAAQRTHETVLKKKEVGRASDYEVLRSEVDVANSKAALIREENGLRRAGVALLDAMGVDQSSRISIAGGLAYSPLAAKREEAVAAALGRRHDIIGARLACEMAREEIGVTRGKHGPAIDLSAESGIAGTSSGGNSTDDFETRSSIGVRLSVPIFGGFEKRGEIASAKAALKKAEATLAKTEENARVEVTLAVLNLRDAEELYLSQTKNVDSAKEALRIVENGYAVGRNSQIEVIDARSALTKAKGEFYNAVYSHNLARIEFFRVTGSLIRTEDARVSFNPGAVLLSR